VAHVPDTSRSIGLSYGRVGSIVSFLEGASWNITLKPQYVEHEVKRAHHGPPQAAQRTVEGPSYAPREPRGIPGKVLARMDWLGRNYEQLYPNPAENQGFFDPVPVDAVILRRKPPPGALAPGTRARRDDLRATHAMAARISR
jgi:hypothetical protein